MRVLISWIGRSDLIAAAKDRPADDPGPVLRLLGRERFETIHLLNDLPRDRQTPGQVSPADYVIWLSKQSGVESNAIHLRDADENLQNQYDRAFRFTERTLRDIYRAAPSAEYALLLSAGFPAAQLTLVIAAQTLFDSEPTLYNTYQPRDGHRGDGVERVDLPFKLSVDAVLSKILAHRAEPPERGELGEAFAAIWGESQAIIQAKQLLQDFNDRYGQSEIFTDELLRALARRSWWGNFRELHYSVVWALRFLRITVRFRVRSNGGDCPPATLPESRTIQFDAANVGGGQARGLPSRPKTQQATLLRTCVAGVRSFICIRLWSRAWTETYLHVAMLPSIDQGVSK